LFGGEREKGIEAGEGGNEGTAFCFLFVEKEEEGKIWDGVKTR